MAPKHSRRLRRPQRCRAASMLHNNAAAQCCRYARLIQRSSIGLGAPWRGVDAVKGGPLLVCRALRACAQPPQPRLQQHTAGRTRLYACYKASGAASRRLDAPESACQEPGFRKRRWSLPTPTTPSPRRPTAQPPAHHLKHTRGDGVTAWPPPGAPAACASGPRRCAIDSVAHAYLNIQPVNPPDSPQPGAHKCFTCDG